MCFKFKHFTRNIIILWYIDIYWYIIAPIRGYTIDVVFTCYTIHNNNINQQLINFVSTTPLALEIIIPIEFAGRLSSFVYFVLL